MQKDAVHVYNNLRGLKEMLSEWAQGVLKQNRIDPEDVTDVSSSFEVTFKDGSRRQICEVWTRVMGYCRPTTEFNVGKYSEFADRKMFTEDKCKCHLEDNE